MIFDLGAADGWIQGDWNATGQEDAEKGEEVVLAGRQHDGHRRAALEATPLQSGGDPGGAFPEIPIGEGRPFCLIAVKADMDPVRVLFGVPLQGGDQGQRLVGNACCGSGLFGADPLCGDLDRDIRTRKQSSQQVTDCFRFGQSLLSKAQPAFFFQAAEKFHARHTVQAEIAVKIAAQFDIRSLLRMQITYHAFQHGNQLGTDLPGIRMMSILNHIDSAASLF